MANHSSDPWYHEDPDYSNCAMNASKFKKVRDKIKDMVSAGKSVEYLCGSIYSYLWDEYRISEEQEEELYYLVDPQDKLELATSECRFYVKNPFEKVLEGA